MPCKDPFDAGVHPVRFCVLPDHPDLSCKSTVWMKRAFLLDHMLQLPGLHPGQEGVGFVQVMLLFGQLVQDEEQDRFQIHLGGMIPEGVFGIHAGADGLSHFLDVLLVVVVTGSVQLAVTAFPDMIQRIVARCPDGIFEIGA